MQNNKLFGFSVFRLNTNDGLFVNNKQVKLAPKVLRTLILFVENKGRVISKNELFEKIWEDAFVEESAISFNISKLRQALAEYDNQTGFIETIPKRGFRFNADVIELDFESAETEIVYEKHQIQEVIIEEINQEPLAKPELLPKSKNRAKIYFLLLSVLLLLPISLFAVWQWQKNNELRSFDSLQTVKLTSWKSLGSNLETKFKVSNSGNFVVFSAVKDETQQLFIKQMNGTEEFNITKNTWHNSSPIWSPDDQQIAYISIRENQTGIYIGSSLGENSNLLKLISKGRISLLKWSKIDSAIFYEYLGNIFKIYIETKEIVQITSLPNSDEQRFFAISNDESNFAYCEKTFGQTDIRAIRQSDGQVNRITNNKEVENNLIWHPDGNRIIYNVSRNGNNQISVGYLNGNEPLQITRGDGDYRLLDISNDGTKVFYRTWEDKSDVWAVNLATGEEFETAKENDAEFWSDISPDGNRISYQKNSKPHAIANLNNSIIEINNITNDSKPISVKGYNQKWLPDGKTLSFFRWEEEKQINNLWTFDAVSGEEKKITVDGIGDSGFAVMPYNRSQVADYSWSNTGNKLVYLDAGSKNVMLYSPDSKETINLTNNTDPKLTFYCPLWSKDDKRIIFAYKNADEKKTEGVWSVENQIAKKIFSTSESLRLLGQADTNDDIFCLSTESIIKTGPIDAKLLKVSVLGESNIIGSFKHISALSFSLSSTGEHLVFTKREESKDNIYLTETKTMVTKKLTENVYTDTLFGSLTWSPDGTKVFFDKQEKINSVSMIENFK